MVGIYLPDLQEGLAILRFDKRLHRDRGGLAMHRQARAGALGFSPALPGAAA